MIMLQPLSRRRTTIQIRQYVLAILLSVLSAISIARGVPAAAEKRDWIVSGFELIEALEGRSGDGVSGEAGRILSNARAIAYTTGVADATSGTRWCGADNVLPHELVDRVYTYLRTLASDRLKGNASSLVAEGLAEAFPCRAN